MQHLGLHQRVSHPGLGHDVSVVGPAVKFSGSENRVRGPPPALGQHTDQVLFRSGWRTFCSFDAGFEGATGAEGRGDLGIEKGWSHCLMCVVKYLDIIGCIPLHGVWCDLSGGEVINVLSRKVSQLFCNKSLEGMARGNKLWGGGHRSASRLRDISRVGWWR